MDGLSGDWVIIGMPAPFLVSFSLCLSPLHLSLLSLLVRS